MAFKVDDRVRETSTTTGLGNIELDGAVDSDHQDFSTIGDGVETYYTVVNTDNGEWEDIHGAYVAATPALTRLATLASSNGGAAVSFTSGTKAVFCAQPASKAVYVDSTDTGIVPGELAITDEIAKFNSSGLIVGGGALHPETVYTSSTTTTDGIAATINITPALSDDTVYRATVKVLARCTTGGGTATTGDVWDAVLYGTFRRVSGTLTRVNWRTVYYSFDEALASPIEVIANDTTKLLQLEVQGFASDTILWEVICELQEVST